VVVVIDGVCVGLLESTFRGVDCFANLARRDLEPTL
jgi:hypothetical protein